MYLNDLNLKPGDLFKRKTHRAYWEVQENGTMVFSLMEPKDLNADDWEIKKKEVKPITAEEYRKKAWEDSNRLFPETWSNSDIEAAFDAGGENNDLKYKDLVKEIKGYSMCISIHNQPPINEIGDHLLKLIK